MSTSPQTDSKASEAAPEAIQVLRTQEPSSAVPTKGPRIAAFVLLAVASLLLWIAGSTYAMGINSLSYKNVNGKINKIFVRINPVGREQIANVTYSVNGKVTQSSAVMPRDRLIKEGETVDVWYDPANPLTASLIHEVDYDTVIVYGALGLFALSFGTFILYRTSRPQ